MKITIKRKGKGASMLISAQTPQDRKELTKWIANRMGAGQGDLAALKEQLEKLADGRRIARKAILDDLARRHEAGDKTTVMHAASHSEYDDGGPRNYISGSGEIECPVCKAAKLRYSRAGYNGHVHASCMNAACVRWME